MLHTWHIHISGLVQGVGFRPFVYRTAAYMNIKGWVSNTNDGVHIEITTDEATATAFYHTLIHDAPKNAIITSHHLTETGLKKFDSFSIIESSSKERPDLLLTPDIAICDHCKEEISDPSNRRYGYAFTTCLNCGPRYSIITELPYDRANTTMKDMLMCDECASEYNDISDRRHYSQTNSCKRCAIKLHLYSSKYTEIKANDDELLQQLNGQLQQGSIVAVKGVGGYLLLCDATNEKAITILRERKHRPAKPFALLYHAIEAAAADVELRDCEREALISKAAPIVLCTLRKDKKSGICKELIAPGLDKIGLMLPYSPLLFMIAEHFGKPLIATSANISGSPIIYKDEDALEELFDVADLVLGYDRDIVAPQDDSVMQFTEHEQRIILRRSRGLAPNYFPNPFKESKENILATGAELKSAFAFQQGKNLYISQYLGDQSTIESQLAYSHTLDHLTQLLQTKAATILTDKHPAYFVSQHGKEMAAKDQLGLLEVQHHEAHFAAVLAENDLQDTDQTVLGIVWDGTGYGNDGHVWGGEFFSFQQQQTERVAHLRYFSQLLGDKMSREPRLSALSLLKEFPSAQQHIRENFSDAEWNYYQKLLQEEQSLLTSSMGRFLDGIACVLGIRAYNGFEGEAAMQLEAMARRSKRATKKYYPFSLNDDIIDWRPFLEELIHDKEHGIHLADISYYVFCSLARMIAELSDYHQTDALAFSGGVFQNALLVDLIIEELAGKKQLYFHRQLSPNDECIGFGQLAYYHLQQKRDQFSIKEKQLQAACFS